jgi:SNF2 family DNA or RNA helicase
MLDIRLSMRSGSVEVSCDLGHVDSLAELRSRFPTAASTSLQAFEVELNDFLVNIYEIANWPPADVEIHWQPELLAIVESNAADEQTVRSRLVQTGVQIGPLDERLLGQRWGAPLTAFQERDVGKLLTLVHGANFSVPGAGKTRAAMATYEARRSLGEVQSMLVVAPKSAFESWLYEAEYCFDPPLDIRVYAGGEPPDCEVLVTNYERLPDAVAPLQRWLRKRDSLMVLDEAHRMKLGPQGAWGSACLALGPYAVRRLILTGTPAPNGANDLANLMSFVWPGQGRRAVTDSVMGNSLRTASQLLRPLFVRTTKDELDLPPLTKMIRRVQLPELHREIYDALIGQASGLLATDNQANLDALGRVVFYLLMAATSPALLAVGASRYEPLPFRLPPFEPQAGSTLEKLMHDLPNLEMAPKYAEVIKIVSDNAKQNRKTIVWSTFIRNLTSLERLLEDYRPAVVHGGTVDREEQLARFRALGDCKVLLSNPATLGEGINLHQVCHDAVYLDRDFSAGRFMQSSDRIHRLGLPPDIETRITVLISEGTIDEVVEQRLSAKINFMGAILDDPAVLELADLDEEPSASAGLSHGDLRALLQHVRIENASA